MKITATIARYLLGFIFTLFGLNGFLHFLPMGSPPPLAAQFFGAMVQSHYMAVVFALQLVCGLMLLANRYVPQSSQSRTAGFWHPRRLPASLSWTRRGAASGSR